jgi:uncharacterized NAD(P)/FAD-binding protein YdhS
MHGTSSAFQGRIAAASPAPARLIAIVGGGFSGTAVAIRLLRAHWNEPVSIVLVDPREDLGGGVAYAMRDYPYPLNVAAGQMSLDGAHPHDFLDFLRAQGICAAPADYLPRQVFGEYLRARFAAALAAAPDHVHCTHRRSRALALRRAADGFDLWLDDGAAVRAHDVVLAPGNAQPASPPGCEPLIGSRRYIHDPWSLGSWNKGELRNEELGSVLLIGSGLTMIDAALRLAAIRPRVRHIHVLSRHGLLPEPQAPAPLPAKQPDVERMLTQYGGSIRRLVRSWRALAESAQAAGGDWREVLALARSRIPAVWRDLDATQRARFLRHARALWEVHRHRAPASQLAALRTLQRRGVLDVHAGRLESLNAVDDAVEVQWRPRGAAKSRAWLVDRVVNCTGPDARIDRLDDPFVQSLLANGLVRADAHGLGIDTATDGRVIGASGAPVERLYYIGPWLRARDWEATAVPELREHAAELAKRIADTPRFLADGDETERVWARPASG